DRFGLNHTVAICTDCGLIQVNPRMDQQSYSEFYRHEYRPMHTGDATPGEISLQRQQKKAEASFHFVFQHSALRPEDTFVVEVGCGPGGILKHFQENGCRKVAGCDLGEQYLEYGRTNLGLDLYPGTLADMAFDERPNLIIYSHVLEHLLDLNGELQRVQ